jgi:hypothetical protein
MGHFYRRFGDSPVRKREHATAILGMPGFVFDRIILPKIDKYQATYGWLVEELKDPAAHPFYEEQRAMRKRRGGFCGCLAPKPQRQPMRPPAANY